MQLPELHHSHGLDQLLHRNAVGSLVLMRVQHQHKLFRGCGLRAGWPEVTSHPSVSSLLARCTFPLVSDDSSRQGYRELLHLKAKKRYRS